MRRLTISRGPGEREQGAVAVMVAILAVVLIGAGAIAVDMGRVYSKRAELQNGADAAALAIADNCKRYALTSGCNTGLLPMNRALQYAQDNSLTSTANVQQPIITVSGPGGTVTVTATVKEPNGNNSLTLFLAKALGISNALVGATATAQWGIPTRGQSILPLTMEACELAVFGSSPIPVPQKIITQGGGNPDCNGRNSSNQIVPGGFAWLTPTGPGPCDVNLAVGDWAQTSPGAAIPAACTYLFNLSDPRNVFNKTVAIPIYDDVRGTGNNVNYHIAKWAGFHVMGWKFPGNFAGPPVWTGSEKGIYGEFVGFSADPAAFSGFTTDPGAQGNLWIAKLIK
ncbi:pilus assembly protein TadG-related protein [Sinomonas sp. ASV322]|uniref:pilus assembly protein TadG-related protein n=1 Tax=Sinomonas sp. ASV322 TaxID=3041920 RepID=UPI0027DB6766|nr:pilus assembly protein TadG-related protein [Sinomonas sp. ASV322]MDQ4501878.1 pilus assembly protein TadG-related protein [Sinomonas sp. ASV322]